MSEMSRRVFVRSASAAMVPISLAAPAAAAIDKLPALASERLVSDADPIFPAIEAHRAATIAYSAACDTKAELEEALPRELRNSIVDAREETIIETDDPRWIASELALDAAGDAEDEAACRLLAPGPTTITGVIAVLQYAAQYCRNGHEWPDSRRDTLDEGRRTAWEERHGTPWEVCLHRRLSRSLERIVAGGGNV